MRKSDIIKYFLVVFIIGILIRSFYVIPLNYFFILGMVSTVIGSLLFVSEAELKRKIGVFLLGGIFLFLGVFRVESYLPIFNEYHVASLNGQVVEFTGSITQEPDTREGSVRYQIDINNLSGDVLVFGPRFPEYRYGQELRIQCRLEEPERIIVFDPPSREAPVDFSSAKRSFDYPGFLAKDGIYSLCFKPQDISHEVIEPLSHIENIRLWLITQKQSFKSIIDKSVNFPASSFLNSILLGLRRETPQSIQDSFSQTGTSHLMAISGLHIVILSSIIFSIFRFLSISKKRAFVFVIIFLVFFVGLIGFKASMVRASLFGLVGILSQVVGRPKRALLVLLWVASILLLMNPLLLVHDIGFQLSFLAVLGLIYLGPFFKQVFKKIPNIIGLRDILIMTMSAQIFVLPWLIYKFGSLSIIAPLANLLVLPVMPIIMIFGILLIVLGLVWMPLAQLIGFITWILVSYILLVTKWLAQIPMSSLQTSLPLWGALMFYLLLGIFIYKPIRDIILKSTIDKFVSKEKVLTAENTDIVTEVIDLKDYNL